MTWRNIFAILAGMVGRRIPRKEFRRLNIMFLKSPGSREF